MRYAPIVIALAAAATARAEGNRTLHLAVHGSVDGAALGDAIARELGVDVAVVEGTCDVPCLDVSVDGKRTATVLYAPRAGSTRSRTIKLGTNTTQWQLVITLLAGNVVRDEARDVLAGLPSRELPRPPAPEGLPADPYPGEPPADEGPAGEPPTAAGPAGQVPAEAGPAAGDPAGEDPAGADPAGEGLAGEGPAGEPPPAEAPAEEPPEAPEPPPAAAAEPPPAREHSFLAFGVVPGLSTDLTHIGTVRHFLSIDLLVGVSGGSSGLSLSGIADVERGLVAGFQIAGVAAIARRVAGTQVAGVAAVSGDLDGVQVAGTAAVADQLDGIQAAGVAAVAHRSAGTQVAGVAAVAGRDAHAQAAGVAAGARGNAGLEIAGVAAVAGHDANVQAGGVTCVARGTANIQIAGVVNVARRLHGVQIAPINVAREVDGIQIGVINVGGSADGFSFGLINIVPGGRHDLEAAIDSDRTGTVLFRHGGRRWHNVYGVGGHRVDSSGSGSNDDVWMYGLGFGPSLAFGHTVIDLEAIGWQVNHGPRHESDVSILGQLRLSIAHRMGPFALVAGGILNTYVTSDQQSPLILERRTDGAPMSTGVTATTWPSAFIGLRI
ncbi:MAG: hypothetical protein E6J90_15840 [Deltaproteobacteria bacterium]|nr:MAG: hypothetical protein E6J90_15840 [Deltaproteobacteria bacterium]